MNLIFCALFQSSGAKQKRLPLLLILIYLSTAIGLTPGGSVLYIFD